MQAFCYNYTWFVKPRYVYLFRALGDQNDENGDDEEDHGDRMRVSDHNADKRKSLPNHASQEGITTQIYDVYTKHMDFRFLR